MWWVNPPIVLKNHGDSVMLAGSNFSSSLFSENSPLILSIVLLTVSGGALVMIRWCSSLSDQEDAEVARREWEMLFGRPEGGDDDHPIQAIINRPRI